MLKMLVYIDGRPEALAGIRFALDWRRRLGAELAVMTVSPLSHGTAEPLPAGRSVTVDEVARLTPGLGHLTAVLAELTNAGALPPTPRLVLRDMPHGHAFVVQDAADGRVPFIEGFGHLVEELNRAVDEHGYDLVVASPPLRRGLKRWTQRDWIRSLALDLHCSLLAVRTAGAQSPYLICSDGTPAARRVFPLLQRLLPAIGPAVDLLCLERPATTGRAAGAESLECLAHARQWLESCGKSGRLDRVETPRPLEAILQRAGDGTVIVMGASLRHDVVRRLGGSLPVRVLRHTPSSLLLVKLPPEADAEFFAQRSSCSMS
jgi:nucleotide-binding universal stress UspA family protein